MKFTLLKPSSLLFSKVIAISFPSVMMIVPNVIYRVAKKITQNKSIHFENINTLPTTHQKESYLTQGKTYQKVFFMILSYGIIYFSFISLRSKFDSSQISPTSNAIDPFSSFSIPTRILEQKQEEKNPESSNQSHVDPDIKTLSIGRTLSFLNLYPISILPSKTGNLAYVITRYSGGLKVIDISDLLSPTIIGSLDLSKTNLLQFKTLKLSADEKTLFAATTQNLEIINVTNPQSPSLISSKALSDSSSDSRPTLALSPDGTILYVAGVALQIFNITDISHPKLIFSQKSSQSWSITSLALFTNTNTLAYSNNNRLEFYDISDPTKPRLLNSYSSKFDITSIVLSKNNKEIYAAGMTGVGRGEVMLEKINVQDPLSPQSVNIYDLGSSKMTPSIIAISPNETNIFVTSRLYDVFNVIGYDLLNRKTMIQSKSLFQDTMTLTIIPQSQHVLVGSKERFGILEFMKDYPNTKAFCRFDNLNKFIDLNFSVQFVEPSSDSNNIWLVSNNDEKDIFEIYNMTNDTSPKKIASYRFPSNIDTKRMLTSKNRGFIQTETDVFVLNTSSSDLTSLGSLMPKNSLHIENFQISNDENIAYIIQRASEGQTKLNAINFANFSSIIENPFAEIPRASASYQIAHRQDLLFVALDEIYIYNISKPMAPIFIESQSVTENGESILFVTFSPEAKTLFTIISDVDSAKTLKIFDISNLNNFKQTQTFALPRTNSDFVKPSFTLSKDMTKGFLVIYEKILVFDLRNLTSPAILGLAPFGLSAPLTYNFFLSSDEKTGYVRALNQVLKVNLDLTYTLYLPQENFLIGKKYFDRVLFLNSNKEAGFLLMDPATDYKITKISLYNIQVIPTQTSPIMTYTSLPSWINFDYENQILAVESTAQRDLGSYTLYSVASNRISLQAFDSVLQNFTNSVQSQDLLTLLISLGYVDNQRFLTATFGFFEDFLLPTQYSKQEKESIYKVLESHRIETFTGFNILPSLNLSTTPTIKFLVNTTSKNSVKIDIRLFDVKAQFLQKTFGTVIPLITENKNRLIIEGSLENINQALRELVININSTICQGEITINDNLNPIIRQAFPNISDYFFHNDIPMLNTSHNLSVQQQIDVISLYTGQYFSINLDPETFKDQYSDSLTYRLVQREDRQDDDSLPSWLNFQGWTLKGTPPEEIFQRQFKFGLIVKNEFKHIEIPVILNIKISWQFIGKLFMKYSPYILTAIGLYISANKIYNILVKKRYRHPKDFYVKVGQEITPNIIFPIRFIAEEKLEGDLISKHLKNKKDLLNENEEEIRIAIKDATNNMSPENKQKLKLYSIEEGQKRVFKYIRNELIMYQLNSNQEKTTKNLFNHIKDKWVDFIEYDAVHGFVINEKNLNVLLNQEDNLLQLENLNNPLLENSSPNIDLLKKALIVHATKNHELNYSHANVDILVHLQKPRHGIFKFLKQDLQRIKYGDKGRYVFGLTYQIQASTLEISGTPDYSFKGNVLVIQIVNDHQRILKEIWIYGVNTEEKLVGDMDELQAKGKEYEIF